MWVAICTMCSASWMHPSFKGCYGGHWHHGSPSTRLIHAPRLHTLGIFHHCPVEDEDGVMLEHVKTITLLTNVDNVDDLDQFIITLHHSPHLETLHLKMMDGSESDSSKSKLISFEELVKSPIICLENTVKPEGEQSSSPEPCLHQLSLGVAAKSLRSMLIYNKRMAGELLPLERRGSSDAHIIFSDSSKCTLQFDTSASNYKLADPFME